MWRLESHCSRRLPEAAKWQGQEGPPAPGAACCAAWFGVACTDTAGPQGADQAIPLCPSLPIAANSAYSPHRCLVARNTVCTAASRTGDMHDDAPRRAESQELQGCRSGRLRGQPGQALPAVVVVAGAAGRSHRQVLPQEAASQRIGARLSVDERKVVGGLAPQVVGGACTRSGSTRGTLASKHCMAGCNEGTSYQCMCTSQRQGGPPCGEEQLSHDGTRPAAAQRRRACRGGSARRRPRLQRPFVKWGGDVHQAQLVRGPPQVVGRLLGVAPAQRGALRELGGAAWPPASWGQLRMPCSSGQQPRQPR